MILDWSQRWKLIVNDLGLELGLKMIKLGNLFRSLFIVGNLTWQLGNLLGPRFTEVGDLRVRCNVRLDTHCWLGKLKMVLGMHSLPRDWWEGARRGRMLNQTLLLRLTR